MKRLLVLLLCAVMLTSISCGKDTADTEGLSYSPIDTSAITESTQAEETYEFFKSDEDTFDISTPFCTLKYPVKWQNFVSVETTSGDFAYYVTFNAYLESYTLPLFTLAFGDCDDGYLVGTLESGSDSRDVYVIDHSSEPHAVLSDEAEFSYMEMCEDVNVVISKLIYDSGMVIE